MRSLKPVILSFALLFVFAQTSMAAETGSIPQAGVVAETIVVNNYVYLRLEETDLWVAAPQFEVVVGDSIKYDRPMEMQDFYSKTLDRTFKSIFFVQSVERVGRDIDKMHNAPGDDARAQHSEISKPMSVQAPLPGEIQPLADGITIEGIHAGIDQLNGQLISLRALVIKVSENVMGKNWITLQDGTGTQAANQLLATSSESVTAGDLVIVKGIIRKDIDIGSGYKYGTLLEDTTFSTDHE